MRIASGRSKGAVAQWLYTDSNIVSGLTGGET